jgi:beta-galactosidase
VKDWTIIKPDETRIATFSDGVTIPLRGFVEQIKLKGAEALANWTTDDDLLGATPAVTINSVGKGYVIYIAGHITKEACATMVKMLVDRIGYVPPVEADANVELIVRVGKKADYLWLLNHSGEAQFLTTPPGKELLSGEDVDGKLKLPHRGVAVLQVSK